MKELLLIILLHLNNRQALIVANALANFVEAGKRG